MSLREARWLLVWALIAATLAACEGQSGEPVRARSVPLYEGEPLHNQIGALRFEAGFVLSSGDPAFGGLSGLLISPDGRDLVAISDHGTIWRASLTHEDDRLVGLAGWRSEPLTPLPGEARIDAEALAEAGDDWVIAAEQAEPLRLVTPAQPSAPMRPILGPGGLAKAGVAAGDKGIETLTDLADGALLAIAEGHADASGQLGAWRIGDGRVERLAYAGTEGFAPTGADRLDQVIYLIERRLDLLQGGFVIRILALDEAQVTQGAPMQARELARLSWPALSENFEGIAVRPGADGRSLLYLISDDNFLPIQRTLLLQFSLAPNPEQARQSGRSGS